MTGLSNDMAGVRMIFPLMLGAAAVAVIALTAWAGYSALSSRQMASPRHETGARQREFLSKALSALSYSGVWVAAVAGVGLTAASVVVDGVAGGYNAGFESGLGAVVDQGMTAAGASAIGLLKANAIGLAKSAVDFAAGPNCRL